MSQHSIVYKKVVCMPHLLNAWKEVTLHCLNKVVCILQLTAQHMTGGYAPLHNTLYHNGLLVRAIAQNASNNPKY